MANEESKPSYKKIPDLNQMFKFLRNRYQTKFGCRSSDVAKAIDERPQCVSSWSTGYNDRKPPLRLIVWLTANSETEIRINSEGVSAFDLSGNKLIDFDVE